MISVEIIENILTGVFTCVLFVGIPLLIILLSRMDE